MQDAEKLIHKKIEMKKEGRRNTDKRELGYIYRIHLFLQKNTSY